MPAGPADHETRATPFTIVVSAVDANCQSRSSPRWLSQPPPCIDVRMHDLSATARGVLR